jgi:restriction system protein
MNTLFDKASEKLSPPQMPTWEGFSVYVLRYLSDGVERSLGEIRQGVADLAKLTDEQRAEQVPSGQLRLDNRIGWATSKLTRVGAIERPSRARYRITPKGQALLAAHPDAITEEILRTLAKPGDEWWLSKPTTPGEPPSVIDIETEPLDPMEQIEEGLARNHSAVAADLLQRLQEKDPYFFETAVVKLLVAMGYGGADGKATVTRRSNDGGIDGIIDRDALGLDRIYIQAKRQVGAIPRGTSVRWGVKREGHNRRVPDDRNVLKGSDRVRADRAYPGHPDRWASPDRADDSIRRRGADPAGPECRSGG